MDVPRQEPLLGAADRFSISPSTQAPLRGWLPIREVGGILATRLEEET
jgi:hypothetical protein